MRMALGGGIRVILTHFSFFFFFFFFFFFQIIIIIIIFQINLKSIFKKNITITQKAILNYLV